MISSRVVACTSQSVAFNEHPSTRGRLTGLRSKPQQKQTCQHLAVVYWRLVLMELSIDGENGALTWCAYVTGFGKAKVAMLQAVITMQFGITCTANNLIIYS